MEKTITYSDGAQEVKISLDSEFSWLEALETMAGTYLDVHSRFAREVSSKFRDLDRMEHDLLNAQDMILILQEENRSLKYINEQNSDKIEAIKSVVNDTELFGRLTKLYKEIKKIL